MRMVRELDTIPFKNGWNIYPSWPIGNYGSFDGHVMKIHSGSFDGQRWIILCSGLFWKFWVAIVQPDICDKTCPNLNCFRGELRYRYGTRVAKQLKGLKGCYINRSPAVLQVFNLDNSVGVQILRHVTCRYLACSIHRLGVCSALGWNNDTSSSGGWPFSIHSISGWLSGCASPETCGSLHAPIIFICAFLSFDYSMMIRIPSIGSTCAGRSAENGSCRDCALLGASVSLVLVPWPCAGLSLPDLHSYRHWCCVGCFWLFNSCSCALLGVRLERRCQ